MMLSKPITVVVVASAVVGLAVVGGRHMRGGAGAAGSASAAGGATETTSGAPSGTGSQQAHSPLVPSVAGTSGPSRADERISEIDRGRNGQGNSGANRTRIPGHRQERVKNGNYTTIIAGFYNGAGSADVKDDRVTITADLTTTDGRSGQFVADNLVFDGPYFYGTGTVLGDTVEVTGRVDAARASRLIATFRGGDGRSARIVGNLPGSAEAGDDNWESGRQPK